MSSLKRCCAGMRCIFHSAQGPDLAGSIARDWMALSDAAVLRGRETERDLEDEAAAGLAWALEWPVRCSVEVLSPTAAAAEHAQVSLFIQFAVSRCVGRVTSSCGQQTCRRSFSSQKYYLTQ